MLELSYIRQHSNRVIKNLLIKNFDAVDIVNKVLALDEKRRALQTERDAIQSKLNKESKLVGLLFGKNRIEEANKKKAILGELKASIKKIEKLYKTTEEDLFVQLILLPNIPHNSVPAGQGAQDNLLVKVVDNKPDLPESAIPHWELAKKYNLIDFDLGNKITGSGFPFYVNKGAKLQRALISFFLDRACDAGYIEYMPPLMVNEASGFGTGQIPDKEGQMYFVGEDKLYLIPTAEVPLTNIYRDVVLDKQELPLKLTAYTPCFRREAGSYGKNVRGLNRLHQFDKVEIVQIASPDQSYHILEMMVKHVESLVTALHLPYRILKLCGGDISFTSALTFDFEVYSAVQQKWLEVSSVSNFESYQANRLKLRYRDSDKKVKLAHTLNGSALALPRILAALLENNQTESGILIPEVLQPYTGFKYI